MEAAADKLDREPRALHRRVNPFAGRAGDEPAGVAHQDHAAAHQRLALVDRARRVERKVRPAALEFPRQKIALLGAFEELAVEVFDALAGAQTAADADADVVELGENPAVARQAVEAQADEERRVRRVAPGDFARRVFEVVVRAQHEFVFVPALAQAGEHGDAAVGAVGADEHAARELFAVFEPRRDAAVLLLQRRQTAAFEKLRARAQRDVLQAVVELAAEREVARGLTLPPGGAPVEFFVEEGHAAESGVNQLRFLAAQIMEALEGQAVDPARAGLVPGEAGLVDEHGREAGVGRELRRR